VGATSQPLGFPAPLARLRSLAATGKLQVQRRASGTGRAHGLSIRGSSEIRHWFKQLSLPHLLRRTAPPHILAGCQLKNEQRHPRRYAIHNTMHY